MTTVAVMPKCAWLTRHPPTPAQRRALSGYVIRQPAFCRYDNVTDLWLAALDITNGHPALIVAILSPDLFNGLARLAHIKAEVPVVKPVTAPVTKRWLGIWRRSIPAGVNAGLWEEWTPPVAERAE